jgi:hypothetical protein
MKGDTFNGDPTGKAPSTRAGHQRLRPLEGAVRRRRQVRLLLSRRWVDQTRLHHVVVRLNRLSGNNGTETG